MDVDDISHEEREGGQRHTHLRKVLPLWAEGKKGADEKDSMVLGVQFPLFILGLLPVPHSGHHIKANPATFPLLQCGS